jgi:hypothetical protein
LGYAIAGGSTGSANGTGQPVVAGGGRGSLDSPSTSMVAPTLYGGGGASGTIGSAGSRTGYAGVVVVRYTKAQVD